MALSKNSIQQAKKILKMINTCAAVVEFEMYDRNRKYNEPDIIYLVDKKQMAVFPYRTSGALEQKLTLWPG